MAIKGKTKSRSRRVVAVAPRPPMYVRKPPIWRRRIFLISVGAVVVAGIVTGLVLNIQSNHRKHLKAVTLTAVNQFQAQVEKAFPDDAQKAPGTSTWQLYPSLSKDLADIESGTLSGTDAVSKATNLQQSAKATGDAIEAVKIDGIPEESNFGEVPSVRGKGATRLVMNDGKALIVQSYRIYGSVGSLMQQAAEATDKATRTALVGDANQLLIQAQTLFSRGFSKITNVQSQLAPPALNSFQPGSLGR
jgi:hypothetical protein